ALAQDSATVTDNCANHLNTSPSPTVGALLNCLAEMQRKIDQLEADASMPSALSSSDITAIIAELKVNHANDIKGEKGDNGKDGSDALAIPSGAVLAFDLPNGCPMGWNTFEEATSRAIVGAYSDRAAGNINAPTEDENGQALSARHYRSWGGTETHKLEVSELPSHDHDASNLKTAKDGQHAHVTAGGGGEGRGEGVIDEGPRTDRAATITLTGSGPHEHGIVGTVSAKGGGAPHNNMPPYLALHYCKKE
ncbi:MAG: hypothetical protein AAF088_21165, partial [Pseudomonadota bacterium]